MNQVTLESNPARSKFFQFAKITLVLIFLVIIAGSVVRMAGAGMGCPDWPMCFGQIVPPTSLDELPENYMEIYPKIKDYPFNAFHTWTEYINRLVGALAGLACLILFIWSFKFIKKDIKVFALSGLVLAGMVFQAWLGAVVVYSVLQPFKITIHMVMALVIVALMLSLIFRENKDKLIPAWRNDLLLKRVSGILLLTVLAQIILGTQVREGVDEVAKLMGELQRPNWIEELSFIKVLHRSFAWIPVLLSIFLVYLNVSRNYKMSSIWFIFGLILAEVLVGIILYYFGMPNWAQPVHMVLSAVLFGACYLLVIRLRNWARY